MPSLLSIRPSESAGRRSSAFVRERYAPIDRRGRVGAVQIGRLRPISPAEGNLGNYPWSLGIRCRTSFLSLEHIQQRDK
jgi:hypothetical protein